MFLPLTIIKNLGSANSSRSTSTLFAAGTTFFWIIEVPFSQKLELAHRIGVDSILTGKKSYNLSWTRLEEITIYMRENEWITWRVDAFFCIQFPRSLNSSIARVNNIFNAWIHCLYSNVVDCLFVIITQSYKSRKERVLLLNSLQKTLIWVLVVCFELSLASKLMWLEWNSFCVLKFNIPTWLNLMRQCMLQVKSTQSELFSCGSKNNNSFANISLFTWKFRRFQVLRTTDFWQFDKINVYSSHKLENFSFFCITSWGW